MEVISNTTSCEKMKELKEFDDSKEGVKGLVDSGLVKLPKIFICPPEPTSCNTTSGNIPVINLEGFDGARRAEIVEEVSKAFEKWGIFLVVNHGIPSSVMKELLESSKKFHEQPKEMKMGLYSRDYAKNVKYYSSADLFLSKTAQWRDTLSCDFEVGKMELEALPQVCGKAIMEYMEYMMVLRNVLSELLSEALGLGSDHLANMEGFASQRLVCHYYPPCPEPHLTHGILKHSDPYFLTILLQDNVGGLQIFHENQWMDVPPVEGSLVVNAGDFLQLISNDKFRSVEHRVIAREVGPRLSAPCFLFPNEKTHGTTLYGPLDEILSENNPPKYRKTTSLEYLKVYAKKGLGGDQSLSDFKC